MAIKSKNITEPTTAKNARQNQMLILGGIVAAALVLVIAVVIIGGNSSANVTRFAGLPYTRTADGAFVVGEPTANITIVEFADFACPACQQYKPTMDEFIDRYVKTGQAKFESRIIMTAGGVNTGYAARLADCAEDQRAGAYWEAYEALYDLGGRGRANYTDSMARTLSPQLNLNLATLLECIPDSEQSDNDQRFAQQLGVSSTPTILVRYGNSDPQPLPGARDIGALGQLVAAAQLIPGS
ncbi:MAG: thioredoxin domain-containing protein [Armatimonadetes bacterium]|nr:thioredoxin domain-containing protein [Anaerolineae bacterium]